MTGHQPGLYHNVREQHVFDGTLAADRHRQTAIAIENHQIVENAVADVLAGETDAHRRRAGGKGAVGHGDLFAAQYRDAIVAVFNIAIADVQESCLNDVDAVVVGNAPAAAETVDGHAGDIDSFALDKVDGPDGGILNRHAMDENVGAVEEPDQIIGAIIRVQRAVGGSVFWVHKIVALADVFFVKIRRAFA